MRTTRVRALARLRYRRFYVVFPVLPGSRILFGGRSRSPPLSGTTPGKPKCAVLDVVSASAIASVAVTSHRPDSMQRAGPR
jgi:hypothetical protein